MSRGHSNISNITAIKPVTTNRERVLVPIEGGADVYTTHELPPLALDKDEWQAIGRVMGWVA